MVGDDLRYVATVQTENLVLVAGMAANTETGEMQAYFEYSNDDGATKYTFSNGETRKLISEWVRNEQPALEVLSTGEIVCTVNTGSELTTYLTQDFGETWTRVDSII